MPGYRYGGTIHDVAEMVPEVSSMVKPKLVRFIKPPTTQCGTANGYKRHQKHGEVACGPCKAAMAEYSRNYRAKIRAGEVTPKKPFSPDRCGTYAGFRHHAKHAVKPCEPCRMAHRRYQQEYRAKKLEESSGTH